MDFIIIPIFNTIQHLSPMLDLGVGSLAIRREKVDDSPGS
jgi:hypothetical protein